MNVKVYVFDVSANRPWKEMVSNITLLDDRSLSIPTKDDLLIIHSTDYNYAESNFVTGENSPYILWVSTEPKSFNEPKQHFYKNPLPHKTDRNHQFWNGLNAFLKALKEKGEANWELLYSPINHLIALSILCQGYLAAHGKESFKISDNQLQQKAEKNKGTTELRSWWEPVLKKDNEIDKELKTIGKESEDVPLIDIIKNRKHKGIIYFDNKILIQGKEVEFTKIVNETYEKLSKILEGSL